VDYLFEDDEYDIKEEVEDSKEEMKREEEVAVVEPIAGVVKDGEENMVEEEEVDNDNDNDNDNNIAVALEEEDDDNDCDSSSCWERNTDSSYETSTSEESDDDDYLEGGNEEHHLDSADTDNDDDNNDNNNSLQSIELDKSVHDTTATTPPDNSSSSSSSLLIEEDKGNDDDKIIVSKDDHPNIPHPTTTTDSPPPPPNTNNNKRWAMSAPNTNLSGSWILLVTDDFLLEYDQYLTGLGFNYFTRKVALKVIYHTSEVMEQMEGGRQLRIIGSNPKGVWDRSLTATTPTATTAEEGEEEGEEGDGLIHRHGQFNTTTADGEECLSEAWWEEEGTVHCSFLLGGGSKYGGGDFESRRYLEEGGNVYSCESTFHPKTDGVDPVSITWKFCREEVVD